MPRHVLTLIAPPSAPALKADTTVIPVLRARLNPVRVVWLSSHACDLEFDAIPSPAAIKEAHTLATANRMDAVFQPIENREKQLLVSDMDSTMINQECIDELADAVGMKAHVAKITERAMNGELDFESALKERVLLLKDLPLSELERTYHERITLMSGARTLLKTMASRGAHTLLVSGGFTYFTSRIADAIGFERDEANHLEFLNGKLTGTVREPILGKEAKKKSLIAAASEYGIALERTLAVGDGANDLPMIQQAGLGVAYHAKPIVEEAAPARIRFNDLTALLYIQGVPQTEWRTD